MRNDNNRHNLIPFNSRSFTCKLNFPEANYKVRMSEEVKENNQMHANKI
jgi:hypothetical protein